MKIFNNIISTHKYFNNTNNHSIKYTSMHLNPQPAQDTVCFKNRDLLKLPRKEILQKVNDSMIKKNLLGVGLNAKVYRITGTDYCIKIPLFINKENITPKSYTTKLTPLDKINHVKAKFLNYAEILEYIEGETLMKYSNDKNVSQRNALIRKIANMPVKSYSDLLHQLVNAEKQRVLFDYNPGNIIIDTKNKKFTAIDFYNKPKWSDYVSKPLTEIYKAFPAYNAPKSSKEKIIYKILMAGIKELKPGEKTDIILKELDFESLLEKLSRPEFERDKSDIININALIKECIKLKSCNVNSKTLKEKYLQLQDLIFKIFHLY